MHTLSLSLLLGNFLFFLLKPDRAEERARIEASGGKVIFIDGPRVEGILAMSRSIGTAFFVQCFGVRRFDCLLNAFYLNVKLGILSTGSQCRGFSGLKEYF